jgi:hypothetical protein
MADESGLSRNRRYIVWDTEKASLNKLQTNKPGSLKTETRELAQLDLVGVQQVTLDNGGNEPADDCTTGKVSHETVRACGIGGDKQTMKLYYLFRKHQSSKHLIEHFRPVLFQPTSCKINTRYLRVRWVLQRFATVLILWCRTIINIPA